VRADDAAAHDPGRIRADLQRVLDRHAFTLTPRAPRWPGATPRAAAARENIADLCDEGSFIEYGALAIAAQARRRSMDDLIANTPADGMVTGIGGINGAIRPEAARTVVMAYDATVLAGTQGMRNHAKTDRMLGIALAQQLPVVLFAEGGGGRPGDTDMPVVAGLHVPTFAAYARCRARCRGRHRARALLCRQRRAAGLLRRDHRHARQQHRHGRAGHDRGRRPGRLQARGDRAQRVQHANGVIDVLVGRGRRPWPPRALPVLLPGPARALDRARPARAAPGGAREPPARVRHPRRHGGPGRRGQPADAAHGFGIGIHTALARIEGRPVGLLANNPLHLGGAIDAPAADKAARFMQLCNAHGLPIVSLVDTPGFMVGPEVEKTAQVRHVSRMFVTAAALRVPCFSVVLRKGYGLGAMGMTAGSFHAPLFTVAWPTGEFGGMGLEGYVRLGFRKELAAAPEGPERDALFAKLLARQYATARR
jgi:acetyl-CoA carboxylase carboxyltransferase component